MQLPCKTRSCVLNVMWPVTARTGVWCCGSGSLFNIARMFGGNLPEDRAALIPSETGTAARNCAEVSKGAIGAASKQSVSSCRRTIVRKIIHVDMDAFYASVEQRDDPKLRGKPVIVAWRGNRSVVCAASYEARAFGVRSAMPAGRAERLCPNAIFVAPDFTRYRAVSRSVREIFKRHTDLIEPMSLDEAYLDVTENKTGLPTATLVARTIREQIRQELNLTASAGVAPNKFLAKLASDWRKPDGLFVIQPEETDTFLLPLQVGRLPGVGKVTGEQLAKLEIKTVGDLRKVELSVLDHHFGRYGLRLHDLARGIDDSEVIPDRPTQSISVEDTFEQDVLLAETEPMIRRLTEKLWSASRKESRLARTVVLRLKTSEFKLLTRSHTPGSPPCPSSKPFALVKWDLGTACCEVLE